VSALTERRLLFVVLSSFVLLASVSPVRAVAVEFNVRMGHQIDRSYFDPQTEFVDLAGTFNGWGSEVLLVLDDGDGDQIYSITIDRFSEGEVFEYKFRQNGQWDGTEEFPGVGGNRSYTVQAGENVIDVWYDDRAPDLGVGELSWWNDRVFYEIFVRSFYDSDGDGIGDFQGLTQKLDYLNDGDPTTTDDLGVTGIWLMPIHASPSYHGYDVTDYRSINPEYGTMQDFRDFMAAAQARGIKVVIDYVMNHTSSQHPWFVASAANDPQYRDYYRWSSTVLDDSGPWGQTVWHWNNGQYFYGVFWSGMPDVNYDNADVKQEIFDAATFWLDDVGVDGFRLDAVLYIDEDPGQLSTTQGTLDFWAEYNAHVKSVKPDMMSVAEAWTSSSTVNRYVTQDRLDLAFEFDMAGAILGAVNNEDAYWLSYRARLVYDLYPYLQYATFLTNHDQNRLMNVVGEDVGRVKAAAGLLLTLPGVPFLYYGEEIGMVGTKPDPDIRRPMQWTGGSNAGFTTGTPWRAIGPNAAQFNVSTMQADPNSMWEHYRQLIAVRNESAALRRGDLAVLATDEAPVLGFLRRAPGETVLVVSNTSAFSRTFQLTGSASDLPPGEYDLVNLIDSGDRRTLTVDGASQTSELSLDGHEIAIYLVQDDVTGIEDPIDDPRGMQTGLELRSGVPNPFDGSTRIGFALARSESVRLAVYDVSGREVAVLHDGRREAGSHEVTWDGQDQRGRRVAAGVYFVRLSTESATAVRKVISTR